MILGLAFDDIAQIRRTAHLTKLAAKVRFQVIMVEYTSDYLSIHSMCLCVSVFPCVFYSVCLLNRPYIFMCLSLSFFVSVCPSIRLDDPTCICPSGCIFVSVNAYVFVCSRFVSLFSRETTLQLTMVEYTSVFLSIPRMSLCVSVCLSFSMFGRPSPCFYVSPCLSFCVSVCPSIR